MRRWMIVIAVGCFTVNGLSSADAQPLCCPPAPTTFVQPMPVVQTTYYQPTVVYRRALRPLTTVVAPAPQVMYAVPQPVMVARPTIPVAVVAPAPVVTTRYRPILGGTVTRTWYP